MKQPARPVSLRRYTVDAAAKALDLLSAFSFREPRLSLADLAARTGIPRPTAFRLLTTLEQAGFVAKVSGEYQLGIKCFVLGNIVAASLDLREKAQRHLAQLRDATGETVHLAVLDGWQVLYLERLQSPHPIGFMRSRIGAIVPAYCTGLGKTLLAHKPPADVESWLSTQTLHTMTPQTITSPRRLMKELRAIRERGYGLDEQEHEIGVRCLAVPIANHTGEVIAAISVAGPADRMPRPLVGSEMAAAAVAAARAISTELGAYSDVGPLESFRAARPAHGGRR
ncbi:MAG TPA: IclR family transcriptional regulator [Vicinamibacterales bacterium]|nr:IclR family transcriptional regulator [Vicinamibacterales bacterium]